MPKRPCSICLREDVQELDDLLRKGNSASWIAKDRQIHRRCLQTHFAKHRNGLLAHLHAGRKSAKARAASRKEFSAMLEAKSLYERVLGLMENALAGDSIREAKGWVSEARESLKLLASLNGELSSGSNVTVQVGVSVERAREAVSVLDEAQALSDAELADRACAMLEAYNASNPQDMRSVGRLLHARAVEPDGQAD